MTMLNSTSPVAVGKKERPISAAPGAAPDAAAGECPELPRVGEDRV